MRFRPHAAAFALLAAVLMPTLAAAQGNYRGFGDAGGFLNILPPGQDGSLNGAEAIAAQGGTYPPYTRDQLDMYGDLVHASPGLTEAQIFDFFKDASFGTPDTDILRTYSPTAGVTVIRDASFGVPHIFGTTRYATMFAQGYTAAEDRLFFMDVLRHYGRGRVSEFIGASPGNIAMDREQLAVAPYKEADLTAQVAAFQNGDAENQAIAADALAYVDGVNAYINEALLDPTKLPAEYPALQQVPQPWKPEDIVATAALVGGIFGKGGGGELTNYCGLKAIEATIGNAATARMIFDDLRFKNDVEAPTTGRAPAPYMTNLGPVNPAANPAIDCASLTPVDTSGPPLQALLDAIANGPSGLGLPSSTSNALLIAGDHTRNGNPIAVFGPQVAYFMPQILVEKDVHGPGIDARGAAFAGTDIYVQLGRGRDYAWSATSAGADNVDQFVLLLCEPGGGPATTASMGYLHDGVCKPIEAYEHTQIAKPTAGGLPNPTLGESGSQCANAIDDDNDGFVNDGCPAVGLPELPVLQCADAVDDDGDGAINDGCILIPGLDIVLSFHVERTEDYGPLVARGTLVDDTPIAIATLRSTYRNELGSALGFRRINDPTYITDGYASFRQALGGGVDYTFNWFYIDRKDIGYQHSCKCPQRAQGVDPYFPTLGDGSFDWQGFIPLSAQPFELNPSEGYLTSWNNKQAPQFGANDREYSYGPTYRSQLLDKRVEALIAAGNADRTDMIDAMEDAGTVDLRGQEVLPLLLQVLGATAPGGLDPRVQDMRDRLTAWVTTETHRRDFDDSGEYDDPQSPAIIDAWWTRLSHAMFDTVSGNAISALRIGLHDTPAAHQGSAFNGGFYGHVQKDLRQVLGLPVQDPWSRTYCGNGNLAACRTALWEAMEDAAADLEAAFGSANVADWKRTRADDEVQHRAVGITAVPPIHWINRPTFQQVVQLEPGACGAAPAGDCRGTNVPGAAQLQVRNVTPDTKDRLQWKWAKGDDTPKSSFGTPTVDTDYRLCIYDGQNTLVSHASAPAGGTCNAKSPKPCWRESGSGFRYVDRDLTPSGVQQLVLRAGIAGKGKITLKGRGPTLHTPALPITHLPVRVQLVNSAGSCWDATYSTTLKNQAGTFKAKSD